MAWFWESTAGDEPVYLGYSWLKPGTGDNADPTASNSLDVWAVVVDSPLFKAGLTQGSGGLEILRIEAVDGKSITNAKELGDILTDKVKGDEISVNVSGTTYLVQLDNPPPADTQAVFRFSESEPESEASVLVQVVETVAEVPVAIVTATGSALEGLVDEGGELVDSYTGLVTSGTQGLLLLGALAAGAYYVYNKELSR